MSAALHAYLLHASQLFFIRYIDKIDGAMLFTCVR